MIIPFNALLYKSEKKIYTTKKITKEYDKFISDASELYCIGNKLKFLDEKSDSKTKEFLKKIKVISSTNKNFKQKRKIIKLGKKCKILCNENNNLKNYNELVSNGVQLRTFSNDSFSDIRGQIKKDKVGNYSMLFVEKENGNMYRIINSSNSNLAKFLLESFNTNFNLARNPLINYIALDLGGVYFDGDIDNFYKEVSQMTKTKINSKYVDRINLDAGLSKGEIDIIEFLEKKFSIKINETDKDVIIKKWNNTWKPNPAIKEIMKYLKSDLNIKILPFSNVDKCNLDIYLSKDYFIDFSTKGYYSCECKMVKPDEDFFNLIIKEESIMSYQILFIDDIGENINKAETLGWNTLLFKNKGKKSYKELIDKLQSKNVINEDDRKQIESNIEKNCIEIVMEKES